MRWTTRQLTALVIKYAPELDKRIRPHLKPTNDSWRGDETYIKVKGQWKYLYRAVDSQGNTLDFLLRAKRDATAQRFLSQTLNASHTQSLRVINVEKNAAIPAAVDALKALDQPPRNYRITAGQVFEQPGGAGPQIYQAIDLTRNGIWSGKHGTSNLKPV